MARYRGVIRAGGAWLDCSSPSGEHAERQKWNQSPLRFACPYTKLAQPCKVNEYKTNFFTLPNMVFFFPNMALNFGLRQTSLLSGT